MSDVIIYQGAAIPFSFSRQNGQPLDVTSVMRTLADITTYAANKDKKYVPYEGQTIACLEDKMLYILELKNGVLVPKQSGGVKLIKRDDNVELTDDAALSALRSVKEIEDRAISRLKRDTAAEVIEFVKGLTAAGGKTTVSGDGKITTLNLLVQVLADTYDLNVSHVATMMRTIIKDYVSSEAFTPGLLGEGFKISKALNGDWNLEIDNIVVRKVMTIFEMVISKVRSVNGGLVISPANGRIKSVSETTGSPVYYVLGIEGDMQFVVDDLVRCQVFSNGHAKHYWVRVASISGNSILVLKSEFTSGVVPAIGDDLVQMGNATNAARQGLIYLTASEDGKPRISVMDGVNSTSTVGKNKVILGCLDGITDADFPADFQPSDYGLYAMNVFLKGIFVLRSGKTIESELTTTNAAVTAAKQIADAAKELANSANALLSDIASDNKLTPSEKQATKKEWEQIVSEKVKNDASADKYSVSKVAYTTAYNTLSAYITPLLASLSTTSDIVGTTFRSTFKAYYDARADLLNSISAKAKDLADAAQGKANEASNAAATAQAKANEANTAAGAAQSTADGAVTNAATANSLLSDIANDNKFTATEKQQTKKEWDVIVSEKPLNNASAVKFSVSTAAYDTAYNALNAYITPLLSNLSATSEIMGSTFRSTFKTYYDARTNLLNAVSEKAKKLADDAQNAANAAQTKADTVTTSLQTFLAGGGLFESKITETKTYADNKASDAKSQAITAAASDATTKANQAVTDALGNTIAEIGKIQVGGRNYILESNIEVKKEDGYSGRKFILSPELPYHKLNDKTITLSVDYYSKDAVFGIVENSTWNQRFFYEIAVRYDDNTVSYFTIVVTDTTDINERKSKSFKILNKNILQIDFVKAAVQQLVSGTIIAKNFKLEISNKATDWTQAPEDVDAQILKAKADAESAAKTYSDAQAVLKETQIKAYADGKITAEELRAIADAQTKLAAAKAYSEAQDALLKTKVEAYADGVATEAELAAIAEAQAKADLARTQASAYADGIVDAEEQRAIADAQAKYDAALLDATRKANDAKDAAISAASVDAQSKANAAQAAAEAVAIAKATLAKTEASAYADGKVTAEEQRAIADAQAKLAEAKADATAKSDAAKAAAITDAASKYPTKTEVSTSITQLSNSISLKADKTEVTGLGTRVSAAEAKITPDAIKLTVKSQTDTIAGDAARSAVDGLQIGGRNYIILSKINSYTPYNSKPIVSGSTISTTSTGVKKLTISVNGYILDNKEYTISGVMKINGSPITNALWINKRASTYSPTSSRFQLSDQTGKFVITETYSGTSGWIFHTEIQWAAGDVITIENLKMELGNKATDWTQAPEDAAADTEAARLAAVAAQTAANNAQSTANSATTIANAAKSRLDDWSADGSISPTEKLTLAQEQKALLDEKTQIVADAAKYAVSSTAYVTAYTNYNGELTYHTTVTPEVIAIRANFATYQTAYYTAKQTILNAISAAAKKYAEDQADKAKNLAINYADTYFSTKSDFTILSNQISSKVSQTDFNALGQRVSTAETSITQQAGQIDLKASKSDLGALTGRVTSTEAELLVHANQIGLKVTAGDVSAGMIITANKITLFGKEFDLTGKITFSSMSPDAQGKITTAQGTADAANSSLTVLKNSLGTLAYDNLVGLAKLDSTVIEGGYIKTNLINATAIVTSVLAATDVTATNLTVTGNSKIGGMSIVNNKLTGNSIEITNDAIIGGFKVSSYGLNNNGNNDAYIYIDTSSGGSRRSAALGNRLPSVIGYDAASLFIASGSGENRALVISATGSATNHKIFGGKANLAIEATGGIAWKMNQADHWCMPGLIKAATYYNSWGSIYREKEWGHGCILGQLTRASDQIFTIQHDIGHTDYYLSVIPFLPNIDNKWWSSVPSTVGIENNLVRFQFRTDGGNETSPLRFTVLFFGRPGINS